MIYFSELNEEHKPVTECQIAWRGALTVPHKVIIGSEECCQCEHHVAYVPVVAEGRIVRGKIAVKCNYGEVKAGGATTCTVTEEKNETVTHVEENFDPINPNYYKDDFGIECIEVTKHFNFCRGNAMKYLWRAGRKNADKEIEDLKKALWYLECEIKRLSDDKS